MSWGDGVGGAGWGERTATIVGLDVRSTRAWPGRDYWRSVCRPPLESAAGPGRVDVEPIVAGALRAAGVTPEVTMDRLAVCVAADGLRLDGTVSSRVEQVETGSAAAAVARAARALDEDRCDVAVALALSWSPDGPAVESAAIVLQRAGADASRIRRSYAVLRLARARDAADAADAADAGGAVDLAESWLAACHAAGIDPRSPTLLDLHSDDRDAMADQLGALAPVVTRGSEALPHCVLGPLLPTDSAVSSMLGIVAAALALRHRVLPPCASPHHEAIAAPFCGDPAPRPWIETSPRRAAVWDSDAACLLLLEQVPDAATEPPPSLDAEWPFELALVSAPTPAALAEGLRQMAARAAATPAVRLRELVLPTGPHDADAVAATATYDRYRAAVVAREAGDLARKLERLAAEIEAGREAVQTPDGLSFADSAADHGRTALIFPGQGSQYLGMLGDLCTQVRTLQVWFERLHDVRPEGDRCPPGMLISPPRYGLTADHRAALERALVAVSRGALATLTACLGLHTLLRSVGVRADAMAGYSNGENAALTACGAWKQSATDDIFAMFRVVLTREDDQGEVPRGLCVAVNQAPPDAVHDAIAAANGRVFVALENCPQQCVLFGEPAATREAARQLKARGAICIELAFDRPHHTALYASRIPQLRSFYDTCDIRDAQMPVYSCAIAALFPSDPAEARELAVNQWARCVRFGATVERMYADGIRTFVEVGPGSTLTGFVRSTLKGRPFLAVPSNVPGRPALEQLFHLLGRLFVIGHDIDLRPLRAPMDGRPHADVPPRASIASTPIATAPHADAPMAAAPISVAPDAAPIAPEHRPPHAQTPAPPPSAPQPSAGAVPFAGLRMFEQHMGLMREFLASQARMDARLTEAVTSRAGRRAAGRVEWPMLGDRVTIGTGRLHATRVLHPSTDGFLAHHVLGRLRPAGSDPLSGLPVVPFTFSMELAAEAAARLAGWPPGALTLRHVRGSRWLALDTGTLTLEIVAERLDADRISVKVFEAAASTTSGTRADARVPAFEAVALQGAPVGAGAPAASRHTNVAAAARQRERPGPPTRRGVSRMSGAQFNARLFHGPLLRTIDAVTAVDDAGVTVRVVVPPARGLFAEDDGPRLRMPAAVLDAASQFPAVWLAERGLMRFGVFPFELAAYEQFGLAPASGTRLLMDGDVSVVGPVTSGAIDITDERGAPAARLTGLKTWIYEFPVGYFHYIFERTLDSRLSERVTSDQASRVWRRLAPLPVSLIEQGQGIWVRVLAAVVLSEAERRVWMTQPAATRMDWLLERTIAKELVLDLLKARGISAAATDLEVINLMDPASGDPAAHDRRVDDRATDARAFRTRMVGKATRHLDDVPVVEVVRRGDDLLASIDRVRIALRA